MQVIKSYLDYTDIRLVQRLRLYHLSRPNLRQWRKTRYGSKYTIDHVDQWVLNNLAGQKIVMVDCAGWYLEQFNMRTTCLESDPIAQCYWPACYIEPDLFTHRPTYVSAQDPVVFKNSWFLKYATVDEFLQFLTVWVKSTTVINFNPMFIQHNHLKYNLIDIVRPLVPFEISTVNKNFWVITI